MASAARLSAPDWLPDLLMFNAIASGFTGFLLLVAGGWVADLMFAYAGTLLGLDLATILRLAGGGMILSAVAVAALARGPGPAIANLCAVFIADVTWVLGSFGLLLGVPSLWTPLGIAAVLAVAFAVAIFAWCEGIALHRIGRHGRHEPAHAGE